MTDDGTAVVIESVLSAIDEMCRMLLKLHTLGVVENSDLIGRTGVCRGELVDATLALSELFQRVKS